MGGDSEQKPSAVDANPWWVARRLLTLLLEILLSYIFENRTLAAVSGLSS